MINSLSKLGWIKRHYPLFAKEDDSVLMEFNDCKVYSYEDDRFDKSYIPSIKPYLFYRYLSEDSERENETYVYLDSDTVILDLEAFKVPVTKVDGIAQTLLVTLD